LGSNRFKRWSLFVGANSTNDAEESLAKTLARHQRA
jgi:hypothetical protein